MMIDADRREFVVIKAAVRITILAVAITVIFITAGFLRQPAFWTIHTEPVELAYVSLTMKMGVHPSLSGYHPGGVEIRSRTVPMAGSDGHILSVVSPVEISSHAIRSFADWPQDPNPFYYKPPLFASLLAFSHHQLIGPRINFYPVIEADPQSSSNSKRSKMAFDVQFWAVIVPFISGLLVVVLTLVFGWRCFGPAVGLLAALFVAAHPAAILASRRIWPEMTLTACFLLAVILFDYFISIRSRAGCLLAGVAFGLAALTDHAALFALPAFWIWASTTRVPGSLFKAYFWMFILGAGILCKTWFVDAGFGFNDFILRPVAVFGSSGVSPDALPFAAVRLFLSFPPLIIAFGSILVFFKKIPIPKADDPEKKSICVVGSLVVSLVATRWLYGPAAPWDERAFAPIIPFLAILAAWVSCRLTPLIFKRATGQ